MPDWEEEITRRLRGLKLAAAREAEIAEEVSQHLEDRYQELVVGGSTEDEARLIALKELSDEDLLASGLRRVEQEAPPEPVLPGGGRSGNFLASVWHDIHYGLRTLGRNPGFTVIAGLTLGLGIGANTAIFSVVDAVLLRPLPFHDPARLVALREKEAASGNYPLTGPDYLDWQAQNHTLESTTLFTFGESVNASGAGEPERVYMVRTQANYFSLLGVRPLLGRTFAQGEDQAGRNHVAVLSYGFWQRHFGGKRDAVGKDLDLNGEKYALVGVMPAWFHSAGDADIAVPLDMSPKNLGPRGQHQYQAIGRLKRGVAVATALADLDTIAHRLEKQYPDSYQKGAVVIPLKEYVVGYSRPLLFVMLAAVGLVLLIACANVANLFLVRATGRHREIAVRQALGASRRRVAKQLLTEGVLLSLVGAGLGLFLGWGCLQVLKTAEVIPVPQPNPIGLNGAVLAFTLGIGLLVGMLVSVAPALQVSHLQLNEELKATVQAVLGPSGRRRILRDALVTGEIAISLALLIGAGLLLRSFAKLRREQVGIHAEGVLTAKIVLPPKKYATMDQIAPFFQQLLDGLKAAPGIESAAVGSHLPLQGGSNGGVTIEGNPNPAFEKILVEKNAVSPEYFHALGIPLLRGRNFTEEDFQITSEEVRKFVAFMESGQQRPLPDIRLVAIINQTMARTFWPNQDPLGKVYKEGGAIPVTVIGVVGDVKEWGLREPTIPQAYYPPPYAFAPPPDPMTILVRGRIGTQELAAVIRSQVHSLDSSLALFNVRTMQEVISGSMDDARYQSLLLGSFAMLALLLAAIGIYGVMAYTVTERTHEIGIRVALGAHSREILGLILRRGALLTLAGAALGVAGALALTRFLASLLFGVQPGDPFTFFLVTALLSGVALSASYIPARRATKVDPMVALRYE